MDKLRKDLDFIMASNMVIPAGNIVLWIKSLEIFLSYVARVKHSICR